MFRIVPQLTVADIRRSRDFYVARLGFRVTHEDPPDEPEFIGLEREDASLFLVSADSREEESREILAENRHGVGVRTYFEVDDARAQHDALRDAGVAILRDIEYNEDEDYTEFSFLDPDGYEIGIYS